MKPNALKLIAFLLLATTGLATDVRLKWNYESSPNTFLVIYTDTPGTWKYTKSLTTHQALIRNLASSTTYDFYVIALTPEGQGSGTSNTVSWASPPVPVTVLDGPLDVTVPLGTSATFWCCASGTELRYQWWRNGAKVTGATKSQLDTPPVTQNWNGSLFKCVVSNPAGTVTSREAVLSVN